MFSRILLKSVKSQVVLNPVAKRNFFDIRDVATKAAFGGAQFYAQSQEVYKDLFVSDEIFEEEKKSQHEFVQ